MSTCKRQGSFCPECGYRKCLMQEPQVSNLPTLEKAIFSLKSEEIRLRREASDHRSSIVLGKEISAEVCTRNADCISVVLEYVRECQQREIRNAERSRQQAIADMIGWDGALPIDLEGMNREP